MPEQKTQKKTSIRKQKGSADSQSFPLSSSQRQIIIHEWLQDVIKNNEEMGEIKKFCDQCIECQVKSQRQKLIKKLLEKIGGVIGCNPKEQSNEKTKQIISDHMFECIDEQLSKLWNCLMETQQQLSLFQKQIKFQMGAATEQNNLHEITENQDEYIESEKRVENQQLLIPENEPSEQSHTRTFRKTSSELTLWFSSLIQRYQQIQQNNQSLHNFLILEIKKSKESENKTEELLEKIYRMEQQNLRMGKTIDEWEEKENQWSEKEQNMREQIDSVLNQNSGYKQTIEKLTKQNSRLQDRLPQAITNKNKSYQVNNSEVNTLQHEKNLLQKQVHHLKDLINIYKKDALNVQSLTQNNWDLAKQNKKDHKNTSLKWNIKQFKDQLSTMNMNSGYKTERTDRSKGTSFYDDKLRKKYGL